MDDAIGEGSLGEGVAGLTGGWVVMVDVRVEVCLEGCVVRRELCVEGRGVDNAEEDNA